jgi:hypothetical protein
MDRCIGTGDSRLKRKRRLYYCHSVSAATVILDPTVVMDTSEGGSGDGPMDLIFMGVMSGSAAMGVVSIFFGTRPPNGNKIVIPMV